MKPRLIVRCGFRSWAVCEDISQNPATVRFTMKVCGIGELFVKYLIGTDTISPCDNTLDALTELATTIVSFAWRESVSFRKSREFHTVLVS
jgi:hypothetical protein